jgi:hypothetical protein
MIMMEGNFVGSKSDCIGRPFHEADSDVVLVPCCNMI